MPRPGSQVFSGSGCQVLTGFQRQQKGAFSCVPVAYRALRTAPENHGSAGTLPVTMPCNHPENARFRGNLLGNQPFGNQSKTAVPVLTPPVNRCLVNHPENHGSAVTMPVTMASVTIQKMPNSVETCLETCGWKLRFSEIPKVLFCCQPRCQPAACKRRFP